MEMHKKAGLILLAVTSLGLAACGSGRISGVANPTDSYGVTSANRLIGFSSLSPGVINESYTLTGLAAGESIVGVSFRPANNLLYALIAGAGGAARVATVSTASGSLGSSVALVNDPANTTAFSGLAGARFGVDFNPVPDRLRVISDTGQNLRINVDTGAVLVDGALNGDTASATGAAYSFAFASACRTGLYVIDPVTDALYLQNPPNNGTLTRIAPIGFDVLSVNGVDIQTFSDATNLGLAVLTTSAGTALYSFNLSTGAFQQVQAFASLASGETLTAFAAQVLPSAFPVTQSPGELIGLTTGNSLVTFNRGSPGKLCTSQPVSGLPSGSSLLGLATRPSTGTVVGLASDGGLYNLGAGSTASLLCTLAPAGGDAFTGLDASPTTTYGIGFNPAADRLRVVSSTGSNLRVNPTPSGGQCLVTTDTALSGANAVTAVAYTNLVPATASTALYGLDTGSDSLIRIGSDPANTTAGDPGNPNSGVVNTVGALGVAAASNAGFVIDGRSNAAFAALQAGAGTVSTLYSVNLGSGAATSVGNVGGGVPLRSLALNSGTAVTVYGLTYDGHLVSFGQTGNLFTPNTLSADVVISGVPAGETLVGLAGRPANGQLYGLSTLGKVYTVNPTSGAAVLASTLAADPSDVSAPFSALAAGATFSVDFNPVVDRLRVVDSVGNNLRINVGTGNTITDATLNGNTGPILGAAYLNAFAGATQTQLFDLDASTLYVQNPPNNGTLTAVGSPGLTAVGNIGFDVAGGANGLVLAAIRTASGTGPSDLYRINLATGVATPVPVASGQTATIGTSSTQQVRSLAVVIR